VGGVVLEVGGQVVRGGVVEVPSFVGAVREVALSLGTFEPICVVGPVGSGKTSVVEYAAGLVGRREYPGLIRVQLSDQVDARLLLGSYHSTDLPGTFLWRPGPLTKALLHGHWLLLEDLDSAPPDLAALLRGLIETRQIFVPGFGDVPKLHPQFRLFATWRTHVRQDSG
jgi:midasin